MDRRLGTRPGAKAISGARVASTSTSTRLARVGRYAPPGTPACTSPAASPPRLPSRHALRPRQRAENCCLESSAKIKSNFLLHSVFWRNNSTHTFWRVSVSETVCSYGTAFVSQLQNQGLLALDSSPIDLRKTSCARRLLSRRRLARRHNRRAEEHAPEASPALPPPGDLGVSLLPPSARLEAGSPLRAPARHHAEGHQEHRREGRRGREHRDRGGDGDVRRRAATGVLPPGRRRAHRQEGGVPQGRFREPSPPRRPERARVSKRRTRRRRLHRATSSFSSASRRTVSTASPDAFSPLCHPRQP